MKNFKIIISIILVCVMVLGIYVVSNPTINEPDADGLGRPNKPVNEMTETDWQEVRIKQYENKYGISEEKRQEYRDTQVYPDVLPDMWYTEAINAMTDGGLLNGYPDGSFHPNDFVTQGQFAKVLWEFYGLELPDYGYVTGYCNSCKTYHDHASASVHWALPYAWQAMRIGGYYAPALCGCTLDNPVYRMDALSTIPTAVAWSIPKYFNPNTREQYYQTEKSWTSSDIPDYNEFKDGCTDDDIKQGHWVDESLMLTAYNIGLTKGVDDFGTCAPRKPMTRAELCQMLYNLGVTQKGQADGFYGHGGSISVN